MGSLRQFDEGSEGVGISLRCRHGGVATAGRSQPRGHLQRFCKGIKATKNDTDRRGGERGGRTGGEGVENQTQRERRKTEGRGRVARHRNRRKAEQCAVTVAVLETNDTYTVIVVREATNTTCHLHGTRLAVSIEDVAKSSIPRRRECMNPDVCRSQKKQTHAKVKWCQTQEGRSRVPLASYEGRKSNYGTEDIHALFVANGIKGNVKCDKRARV